MMTKAGIFSAARYAAFYIMPPLLWAGLIFYLSSIPGLKTPFSWDYALRKAAHAAEYAVLYMLIYRAFAAAGKNSMRHALYTLALTVFYAVSDEYHQSFVAGRFCSSADTLIDSAGALAGLYLSQRINKHHAGNK